MRLPQPAQTLTRRQSFRALGVFVLLLGLMFTSIPADAAMSEDSMESCLVESINAERAAVGLVQLRVASEFIPEVRAHSAWMSDHEFQHMTTAERLAILPSTVVGYAENIVMSGDLNPVDCANVHNAVMGSPGHRANVLLSSMRFATIGAHIDEQGVWVTQLFFDATGFSPEFDGRFWDDDGLAFESDIEQIATAGITSGCGLDRFCPNGPVTREQMAAFLVRSLDLPDAATAGFTDTFGNMFANDIDRLAASGITYGCSTDEFCPRLPVTRGQMAAFLVRAMDLPDAAPFGFKDTQGNTFAKDIDRLAAAGVAIGCGENLYCPNQPITRAEMAAFLVRGLGL